LARHTVQGSLTNGKSIFLPGEDLEGLITAANGVIPTVQANGRLQWVVDAARAVGFDRVTGNITNVYTVVTDAAGNLVTAFPGVP
jgi:hypothetical protein